MVLTTDFLNETNGLLLSRGRLMLRRIIRGSSSLHISRFHFEDLYV